MLMNINEIPIQQFDRRDKLMKGNVKSRELERDDEMRQYARSGNEKTNRKGLN
jgi:hypothetical protein